MTKRRSLSKGNNFHRITTQSNNKITTDKEGSLDSYKRNIYQSMRLEPTDM